MDRGKFEPVVVLFAEGPLVEQIRDAGVKCHVLPLSAGVIQTRKDSLGFSSLLRFREVAQAFRFVWRISRVLRHLNVDLVHTNSLKSDLIGGVAARLAGLPVIWHVRDRIVPEYLPTPVVKVFRFLCRIIPNRVITNSHATLRTLIPHSRPHVDGSEGRSRSPLAARYRVIHDGTLVADYDGSRNAASSEVNDSPPLIGLLGRLTEWKGQHIFLRAAAIVRREFPRTKFQIVGSALFNESDYEAEIRRLCTELGLDDCVEFTGFRADVPKVLEKLTLLVHASTTGEPFGQVVIEAMAAAKPLVATNGGGIPEIVDDGRTGLLVPMSDHEAMAAAICKLLSDPVAAIEMGRRGRQRVIEHFSIDLTARRVERLFEETLSARRARQPRQPSPFPRVQPQRP
ncbi:MAG: glycosyltransferase [Burkholderiales bacterium]|nr:glycosyltransferase [Phycisphaerae bacterium]